MLGKLALADPERFNRSVHGGFREPPCLAQPLAQPHNARKPVKDAESVFRRAGDQEETIVGSQIQRRISGRALFALPCGFGLGRPPRCPLGARLRLGVFAFVPDRLIGALAQRRRSRRHGGGPT